MVFRRSGRGRGRGPPSVGRPADSVGLYLDLSVFSNKSREYSTDGSEESGSENDPIVLKKLNRILGIWW